MTVKKRFILLPLFILALYSVYWCATIAFIEDGFMSWITQEIKTNQADIQFVEIKRSGFPFHFTLTVDRLTYAQKQQGMQASIPTLVLNVNPLNWYSTDFSFPNGANIITTHRGEETTIAFKSLHGIMKTPVTKAKTDFAIHLNDTTIQLPQTAYKIDMAQLSIVFNASPALPRILSEQTVTAWRNNHGEININDTGLRLGAASLDLTGALSLNAINQPQFAGHAVLTNGQSLLNTVAQLGRLPSKNISMAQSFLKSFEKSFPNPDGDGIKMPLTIRGDFLSLGPIPLLPIPQFHWDAPHS